jgi:4-hydroxy-tetrahydrodipicolinate synthase
MNERLFGIFVATITPFDEVRRPALGALAAHLQRLAREGCHGTLLLGTAGESMSFSVEERLAITRAIATDRAGLQLVVGTGAASLPDAVVLTRAAFDSGADGVMIAPPFFYRQAPLEGLVAFYSEVLTQSVPGDGAVLLYHYPKATGVPITFDLIRQLRDRFPDQLAGIKDSSGDGEHLRALRQEFPDMLVFVGDDRLLSDALSVGGVGAITALANVVPEKLRAIYDVHGRGEAVDALQAELSHAKRQLSNYPTVPAAKALLLAKGLLSSDYVRPPLQPLRPDDRAALLADFGLNLAAHD